MKRILAVVLVMLISLTVVGCGSPSVTRTSAPSENESAILTNRLSEVAPPETIQALRGALEVYQPQVKILSPRADEVIQSDRVSMRFQVKDLPLFKDEELGLGPHLHVFLDNQPYKAVYNTDEPLVVEDLTPGTHTIRVFASRPWHESFKNEGAFAQTTFHVYTKTPDNQPDPTQPLLTYSRPQGSYGAEPILLDFYLTNAPLHLIAQERSDDDIRDWKVRCTVNGQSFTFNAWDAIYLKGLKPGKNWVQLELLDENNNPFSNTFNNTARIITYEPSGDDTLSKLVRGDLSEAEARGIVDPNYVYVPELPALEPTPDEASQEDVEPEPEVPSEVRQEVESREQEDILESQPKAFPEPLPSPEPVVEPTPGMEPIEPEPLPSLVDETFVTEPTEEQDKVESEEPEVTAPTSTESLEDVPPPEQTEVPASVPNPIAPVREPEAPKARGFFDRFRRRSTPSPTPAPIISPEPIAPELVSPSPEESVDIIPNAAVEDTGKAESEESELSIPPSPPNPEVPDFEEVPLTPGSTFEEIPTENPAVESELGEPEPVEPEPTVTPTSGATTSASGQREFKRSPVQTFFNRFRRPAPTRPSEPPSPITPAPPEIPEVIEIPEATTEVPIEVPDVVTPDADVSVGSGAEY